MASIQVVGTSRPAPRRRLLRLLVLTSLLGGAVGCSSSKADKSAGPARAGAGVSSGASASQPITAGPSAAKAAGGKPDACRLVTAAEARAALGKAVRPAKAKAVGATGRAASCTYESTDFATGTSGGAALVLTLFPHSSMSKAQFDSVYSANGSRAVPGLGDGAWYLSGMLNIYAHGSNLSVSIVSLTGEATADQLAAVAKPAVQRL